MSRLDRTPTPFGRWVAVSAALVALVSSGLSSWPALGLGAAGLTLVGVGLHRGTDAAVTVGAVCLLAGSLVAAVDGAAPALVLVAVTASVVAWDVGGTAIGLGAHLGRDADVVRLEAVHAGASVAVGAVTAGVGYGLYRAGTGGHPMVALLFLTLAAVALVAALD